MKNIEDQKFFSGFGIYLLRRIYNKYNHKIITYKVKKNKFVEIL